MKMCKHVVLFKMHEKHRMSELRELLLTMKDKVPQIQTIEVGLNFTIRENAYDVSLIIETLHPKAIGEYLLHPYHQEVVAKINVMCSNVCAVDYMPM